MRTYCLLRCGHCGEVELESARKPCVFLPDRYRLCAVCLAEALAVARYRPQRTKPKAKRTAVRA